MTGQELVGECWQDSELELDLIMELPDWLANSLVPILERFTEGTKPYIMLNLGK